MPNRLFLAKPDYFLPRDFSPFKGIYASSNRRQGNMSLSYGDTSHSLQNRRDFLEALGIDYRRLVCAQQVHGKRVAFVGSKDYGRGAISYETCLPETDALITDQNDLPLAVFTADCLSVFLYDSQRPAIGLVHAGWRSTKHDILARAAELMREKFGTNFKDLYAYFGPAIRGCCYKVGEEFKDLFLDGLSQKGADYYLDLALINKNKLLELGLPEANISDSCLCTSCKGGEFFSYRREGASCGRMMSVAMLK